MSGERRGSQAVSCPTRRQIRFVPFSSARKIMTAPSREMHDRQAHLYTLFVCCADQCIMALRALLGDALPSPYTHAYTIVTFITKPASELLHR